MNNKINMFGYSVEQFVLTLIRGNDYTQLVYDIDYKCLIQEHFHVIFDIYDVLDYLAMKTANYQIDRVKLLMEEMETIVAKINNVLQLVEYGEPEDLYDGAYIEIDYTNKKYFDFAMSFLTEKSGIKYNQEVGMPKELETDEAKRYFDKAINLGLLDNKYNWLEGTQMLAYFVSEMSNKLHLGKGNRISWKPFETLFKVQHGKLRLNLNDIQKSGNFPRNKAIIDKIFK